MGIPRPTASGCTSSPRSCTRPTTPSPRPTSRRRAVAEMLAYGGETAARKRDDPGDDIASALVQAEIDGDRLTDGEFQWFFLLLVNAGGDTTRNLLVRRRAAAVRPPRRAGPADGRPRRPAADRGRGDAALHVAGGALPAHGDGRHGAPRSADLGRRQGDGVLRLGQPGRRRVPRSRPLRRGPRSQPAHGVRRWRTASVPRPARRPYRDRGDAARAVDPAPRPRARRRPEPLASNFIAGVRSMPVAFTPGGRHE